MLVTTYAIFARPEECSFEFCEAVGRVFFSNQKIENSVDLGCFSSLASADYAIMFAFARDVFRKDFGFDLKDFDLILKLDNSSRDGYCYCFCLCNMESEGKLCID